MAAPSPTRLWLLLLRRDYGCSFSDWCSASTPPSPTRLWLLISTEKKLQRSMASSPIQGENLERSSMAFSPKQTRSIEVTESKESSATTINPEQSSEIEISSMKKKRKTTAEDTDVEYNVEDSEDVEDGRDQGNEEESVEDDEEESVEDAEDGREKADEEESVEEEKDEDSDFDSEQTLNQHLKEIQAKKRKDKTHVVECRQDKKRRKVITQPI